MLKRMFRTLRTLVGLGMLGWGLAGPVAAQQAVDYLSMPGPMQVNGIEYHFAWSSHPGPIYYKHEYVPAGQRVERYDDMLMIDVITERAGPVEMARSMITQLEKLKQTNPVTQYEAVLGERPQEIILDFLMSDVDEGGGVLLEWNAYRYVPYGDNGTMLLAISHREYGESVMPFLRDELKAYRKRMTAGLVATPLPRPSLPTH